MFELSMPTYQLPTFTQEIFTNNFVEELVKDHLATPVDQKGEPTGATRPKSISEAQGLITNEETVRTNLDAQYNHAAQMIESWSNNLRKAPTPTMIARANQQIEFYTNRLDGLLKVIKEVEARLIYYRNQMALLRGGNAPLASTTGSRPGPAPRIDPSAEKKYFGMTKSQLTGLGISAGIALFIGSLIGD